MRKDMGAARGVAWVALIVTAVCFSLVRVDLHAEEGASVSVDVDLFASAVLPGGVSIIVGDRGKIFLSEDGARTWKATHSGTKKALLTVYFPDDRHGWAAGQGGVIVHSSDGGRTWEAQTSGVDVTLLAMDFFDPRHGLAVGADATVVRTSDGGRTWKSTSLSSSLDLIEEVNLFAVSMTGEQKACVTGDGGRIFTTEDGGQNWVQAKSPLYDEEMMEGRILYSMAYDAGILYAVGIDGAFVTSKDQGKTWVERETGFPGPELFCIDVEDGVGLAGGSGGHVLQTLDGGSTWSLVEVPEKVTRYWLSGVDLQNTPSGGVRGLIVGQEGTSGRLENGALTW